MKTPDEIKKWLECCTHVTCNGCPYDEDGCATSQQIIDALEYIQQLERRIGELTENVAQLEAALPKWISVEDRLPAGEVLAANFAPKTCGYQEYIIGYVSGEKCTEPGKCFAENDYEILYNVTHWMSLPSMPEPPHMTPINTQPTE